MDDHNIRIEFDLRPEKEAKLVAALETTVLICFASIAKNLNFVTKAMVSPEAVVQRIEGSVINVVLKMNEFWSGEAEINKGRFDNITASMFVLKLLNCFIRHQTASLELMNIDPHAFDPPLTEVDDKLLEDVSQLFRKLQRFAGTIPVTFSTQNNYCAVPKATDPFWTKIQNPKDPISEFALEKMADLASVMLRIVDNENLNCWTGKVNNDTILPLKFAGKARSIKIAAVSGSILEVKGTRWDGIFWIFNIDERRKYPEGIKVEFAEDNQPHFVLDD